jgi:hypothetical protein
MERLVGITPNARIQGFYAKPRGRGFLLIGIAEKEKEKWFMVEIKSPLGREGFAVQRD